MERLDSERDGTSIVHRIGSIAAGAVVVSVAASLPAVIRMGDAGSALRAFEQWSVLSALAMPVALLFVVVVRRASVGLRILAGNRARVFALGALWWSVVELGLLSIVGTVLRKTTHHHALAGVTFAIVALFSGVILAVIAWRTTQTLARGGNNLQRLGLVIATTAALVAIVLVGVRMSRADGLHPTAALVDVLSLAVISALASSRAVSHVRPMAVVGIPAALLVGVLGFAVLRTTPTLRAPLTEAAPVHAFVVEVLLD